MKKACLFTNDGDYVSIRNDLNLFIGNFEVEDDVEPFMLGYRNYDLYVLNLVKGFEPKPARFFKDIHNTAKTRPTRVFALWSEFVGSEFARMKQQQIIWLPNVVYCDTPNWVHDLLRALKLAERLREDAN